MQKVYIPFGSQLAGKLQPRKIPGSWHVISSSMIIYFYSYFLIQGSELVSRYTGCSVTCRSMALVSHSSHLYDERMAEDYPAIPTTAIRLTHLISSHTRHMY